VIVRARLAECKRVALLSFRYSGHGLVNAHAVIAKTGFAAFDGRAERGEGGVDGALHGGGEGGWEGAHACLDAAVRGSAGGETGVENWRIRVAGAGSFHLV